MKTCSIQQNKRIKMEIIISNINNKERIEESVKRIIDKIIDETLVAIIKESPIIITDEKDALKIYNKKDYNIDNLFIKAYTEGPGAGIQKKETYLIAINLKNNDELRFGNDELDGVLSHELGHKLNKYDIKPLKSVIEAFALATANPDIPINNVGEWNNQLDKKNQLNSEFFADYFSKRTNCSEGLISSIELAMSSNRFLDKNEFFKERLIKLRSDEVFYNEI